MIDCESLPGHLREICKGSSLKSDGYTFSPQERAEIVGRRLRREVSPDELPQSLALPESASIKVPKNDPECSSIGTALKAVIEEMQGGEISCKDCRSEVLRLNRMTPFEVSVESSQIASAIVERGKKMASKWYQRAAAKFLPSLVASEVHGWIQHAIEESRSCESANFCWAYFSEEAEADEIRWSIRSVERNYRGTPKITIIGDCPPWYKGHFIEMPRVPEQPFRRYRDTLSKIKVLIDSEEITGEIVWCMDDCYFLKRGFTISDVSTPKLNPRTVYRGSDEFSRRHRETRKAVESMGMEYRNYATHLPQVVDREKLRKVFELFDFSSVPLCWESIYGCMYYPDAPLFHEFLHRVGRRKVTANDCEVTKSSRVVLNHHNGGWSEELHKWLSREFPE